MSSQPTAKLFDLSTGRVIAQLDERQLALLRSLLVQESPTDAEFLINGDTLAYMRQQGAGELAELLAPALAGRAQLAAAYAPLAATGTGRVRGRLLHLESAAPAVGHKVELYDEDIASDDLLGWCYTDQERRFECAFEESAFKNQTLADLEGKPEVKLAVYQPKGHKLGVVGIVQSLEADFGEMFVSGSGLIAPVLDTSAASICPKCGATYRAGFAVCNDCQAPLRPLQQAARV